MFIIGTQDEDEDIKSLKRLGITDVKVVDEPKNYYWEDGFEGDTFIQFTDTTDNKGMKFNLQYREDDDTGEDIDLDNPKQLKKWLDCYRVK